MPTPLNTVPSSQTESTVLVSIEQYPQSFDNQINLVGRDSITTGIIVVIVVDFTTSAVQNKVAHCGDIKALSRVIYIEYHTCFLLEVYNCTLLLIHITYKRDTALGLVLSVIIDQLLVIQLQTRSVGWLTLAPLSLI